MWTLFIVHLASFWLSALEALRQPRKSASLTLIQLLPLVLFNQLLVTPLCIWGLVSVCPTLLISALPTPTLAGIALIPVQYALMIIIMNAAFALAHYSFHRIRWFYLRVHSLHHRLKVPHPAGAIYAHPLEHVLANLLPVGLALGIMQPHHYLALVFIAHVSWETVQGHTPYIEDPSGHNLHHRKGACNYDNSPYLFDKLIGTYQPY